MITTTSASCMEISYTAHPSTSQSSYRMRHACWRIIFTNPEDFVPLDLEVDRWLVVVRSAFLERNIQPLGLASPTPNSDYNWTDRLTSNSNTEALKRAVQQTTLFSDLIKEFPDEDFSLLRKRFVLIVDGKLRNRRTFAYTTRLHLPSPLDILYWADSLRASELRAA